MRRLLTSCLVALASIQAAHAQNVNLTEAPLKDSCVRIELSTKFDGKISVQQEGKTRNFPHKAEATHAYAERVLVAEGVLAEKSARQYATAEGTISFNNNPQKRLLRADRTFMVAHRAGDNVVAFSPKGALSREEMELTEHFDSLAVPALVPGRMVAVGETWKLPSAVVMALCDLDGLAGHTLECKLESLKDAVARVSVSGTVDGIDMGAQVKMLVNATCDFDTKEQRVVRVDWKQSDQRQQGPVSPALSGDVVVTLKRTPIKTPAELSDFALVPVPQDKTPPAALTNITFRDPKGRYEFKHARDWHVVSSEESPQVVLRLLERGDFVAQATITPLAKAAAGQRMALKDFAELMAKTPGWEEENQIDMPKEEKVNDHVVYRVAANGALDGTKATQYFYLVHGPRGEQLMLSFSMTPNQTQKLGDRDMLMVRELVFPQPEAVPVPMK